jgi:hypothetical protein
MTFDNIAVKRATCDTRGINKFSSETIPDQLGSCQLLLSRTLNFTVGQVHMMH